ncbi:MAG: hypothetical protein WCD79_20670 [Chthoniobacteraceae bacterium]
MSTTNLWQIEAEGFPAQSFASLGLCKPRITKMSMSIDTAAFSAQGAALDGAFLWPWGTFCTITKEGKPWFQGTLVKPESKGDGKSEGLEYQLSGPWWDLEQCTYQQQASFYNGNASSPAAVLGLTPLITLGYEYAEVTTTFTRLTTGQQIMAILYYAISCGAHLQIGLIDPGVQFPISKEKATPASELIKKVMKWVPDQVFTFDYTTSPPTASVIRRANAKTVTYSIQGPPANSISLTPRNDLQVPVVGLFYIYGSNAGGSNWSTQSSDIYPPGGNVRALRALVAPLELSGGSVITQKQPVTTQSIPQSNGDGTGTGALIQWFANHVPSLKRLTLSKLEMVQNSWFADMDDGGTDGSGQKDVNGNTLTSFATSDLSDLPRELVTGSIAPWMAKPGKPGGGGTTIPTDGYVHAARMTIACQIEYNGTLDDDAANYYLSNWINNTPGGTWFYVTITSTDAITQTYQKPISETNAETPPAGLAEYVYNALAQLHQEGDFPIKEQECSGAMQVGMGLNLTGGRAEWAGMQAQIQRVVEDLDAGTTTASVGPPKHLSPSELLDLLRSWRTVNQQEGLDPRSTGTNDGNTGGSDGIGPAPSTDNSTPPAPATFVDFQLSDQGGGNLGIYGGTVSDTTSGGMAWVPSGLTVGQFTAEPVDGSDSAAWLVISYTEELPANITAVTFDTGSSVPRNESGTLYVPLGSFTISGGKITITSSPIGSQVFDAWQAWFFYPATYSAECNPV